MIIASIKNMTIYTDSRVLVKDFDLEIHTGNMIGIAGESGSGKTMAIRAILGILPKGVKYTADQITMFGIDFLKLSEGERRRIIGEKIGFVPQNTVFYLHPMLKIKKQITDNYTAYKKGNRKQALIRASQLLKAVGFEDTERILNAYPWELSGGMRQRVNIAMALMSAPEILLADEPTTALDAAIQKQIMDLLASINKETGIAIVMVSHDLGMLENYCRKILVMYAGRGVEFGYTKDIFNAPVHPYTKALMSVSPSLRHDRNDRLPEIPGYVPDSGRETEGCIFAPRCRYATARCNDRLEITKLENIHECLCVLAKENEND